MLNIRHKKNLFKNEIYLRNPKLLMIKLYAKKYKKFDIRLFINQQFCSRVYKLSIY